MSSVAQALKELMFEGRPLGLEDEEALETLRVKLDAGTIVRARRDHRLDEVPVKFVLMIVRAGVMTLEVPATAMLLEAGDILFIPNFLHFNLKAESAVEVTAIACPVRWVAASLLPRGRDVAPTRIPADFFSTSIITALAARFNESESVGSEIAQMFAEVLLQTLSMRMTSSAMSSASEHLVPIIHFVAANLQNDELTPQMAARHLKCSLRSLHHTCSSHNISFNDIVLECRLVYSSLMLRSTQMKISEIAYNAGFTSLSHFCRQFKGRYGMVASRFRRELTEGEWSSA